MPSSANDTVEFLANSPDRLTLLRNLLREPASPSELAAAFSFARRSVQRNLSEFVDRGWVETDGGTYRITVTGALIANEHAEYVDAIERIEDFAPFFRHLPDRDHAPDPEWLADATMTVATEGDPQAPVHQYVTSVKQFDAERIRMISPVLSRLFHEAHATLALRGTRTELLMPAKMIERARDRNPTEFEVVTTLDIVTLYEYPDQVDIGLTLGDDRLLMAVYDSKRQLNTLIESDDSRFHTWAEELFDRYKERSSPLTP